MCELTHFGFAGFVGGSLIYEFDLWVISLSLILVVELRNTEIARFEFWSLGFE